MMSEIRYFLIDGKNEGYFRGRSAYGYQRKKEIDTTALWGQLAELEVWRVDRRSFRSSIPGS